MAETKKRHLFILNNDILKTDGFSGSDVRALAWSKIFSQNGYQITAVTSKFGLPRYKKKKFRVISTGGLPLNRFGYLLSVFFLLVKGIFTAFREKSNEQAIIYSSSDLLPDFVPALILKFRFPQSYLISGLHLLAKKPSLLKFDLKKWYYFVSQRFVINLQKKYANLVLVSNLIDRGKLLKDGFKNGQVLVTYGAPDWDLIRKEAVKTKKYDAVYVGRFHPQKGLEDLLKIWKMVIKKLPKAKLLLLGELEPLKKEIDNMGLKSNLRLAGIVDGFKKYQLIKESKIFVFPSNYESFGLVIAEAMACGLPIIAYDLPVYREIWKKGMIKVPMGNLQLFSEKLIGLLENSRKRKLLSYQAQSFSKRFTWPKTAKMILKKAELFFNKSNLPIMSK